MVKIEANSQYFNEKVADFKGFGRTHDLTDEQLGAIKAAVKKFPIKIPNEDYLAFKRNSGFNQRQINIFGVMVQIRRELFEAVQAKELTSEQATEFLDQFGLNSS